MCDADRASEGSDCILIFCIRLKLLLKARDNRGPELELGRISRED